MWRSGRSTYKFLHISILDLHLLYLIPYFNVSDQSDCSITGGLNHLYHRWINLYHWINLYTTYEFYDIIKMASTTWCRTVKCHNVGVVTRYMLKLFHEHHITCALLAIQKINARLQQESSKAMERSQALSFKRRAVPVYSQDAAIVLYNRWNAHRKRN